MDVRAIRTEDLTKRYGRRRGIEGVSLEVGRGEVFGFLGPNGAGKSTTIRLLLDLIRPSRGRAEVLGLPVASASLEIRARTGYLPGDARLWAHLTGEQLLEFLGAVRGDGDGELGHELAERLGCDLTERIGRLSHGNRQKVALIQALAFRPELVILDEPTQGLDPLVQHEFHRILGEVRDEGRTVFLSSHDLTEVRRVCDRVAIVRWGELAAVEDVGELLSRALRTVTFRFDEAPAPARFRAVPGVRSVEASGDELRCEVAGSVDPLLKLASAYRVLDVSTAEAGLEEVFLAFYEGGGRRAA